jgi:hypothetical protein
MKPKKVNVTIVGETPPPEVLEALQTILPLVLGELLQDMEEELDYRAKAARKAAKRVDWDLEEVRLLRTSFFTNPNKDTLHEMMDKGYLPLISKVVS